MSNPPSNLPFESQDDQALPEIPTIPSPPVASPQPMHPAPSQGDSASSRPPVIRTMMDGASNEKAEDMFSDLDHAQKKEAPLSTASFHDEPRPKAPIGKYVAMFVGLVVCMVLGGGAFWYFAIREKQSPPPLNTSPQPVPTTNLPEVVPDDQSGAGDVPFEEAFPDDSTNGSSFQDDSSSTGSAVLPYPVTEPPTGTTIPLPDTQVQTDTVIEPSSPSPAPRPQETSDADADGLTDQREQELGLDPNNPDSDSDGLTDGDEVLKYGTNPMNPDTDGDSFADGLEVRNGYNPQGSGTCAKPDCTR